MAGNPNPQRGPDPKKVKPAPFGSRQEWDARKEKLRRLRERESKKDAKG